MRISHCTGFSSGLSSALKDRDLFEDPLSSSASATSPSLSVTPPGEPPSPNVGVFGSGSSTVTTVMNEHPPTLSPASTKPQVTNETGVPVKGWVCCVSLWFQCGGNRVKMGPITAVMLPQASQLIFQMALCAVWTWWRSSWKMSSSRPNWLPFGHSVHDRCDMSCILKRHLWNPKSHRSESSSTFAVTTLQFIY